MPEMPELPPFIPKPPVMPDLPPEIPFPDGIEWDPYAGLPPWWTPPDLKWPGIPSWIPDWWLAFADRLMRLIIATAIHRASLGLVPGFPPFDLRTLPYIFPELVNLAIAWFVTMWNTHALASTGAGSSLTYIMQYADDCYVRSNGDFADQGDVFFGTGFSGDDVGTALLFRSIDVPRGTTLSGASIGVTSAAEYPSSNDTNVRIRASKYGVLSPPASLAEYQGVLTTDAYVDWNLYGTTWTTIGRPYYSKTITPVIQEVVNQNGWSAGKNILVIMDDFAHNGTMYRGAYGMSDVPPDPPHMYVPRLSIAWADSSHQITPVSGMTVASIDQQTGAGLLAWLSQVEGVCWPHLLS